MFASDMTLKTHKQKYHNRNENSENAMIQSDEKLKPVNLRCNTSAQAKNRQINLQNACESCDYKVISYQDLSSHQRDVHGMVTFSISPKSKCSKLDGSIENSISVGKNNSNSEVMEVDQYIDTNYKGSKNEDCPGSVKQFVAKGNKFIQVKI